MSDAMDTTASPPDNDVEDTAAQSSSGTQSAPHLPMDPSKDDSQAVEQALKKLDKIRKLSLSSTSAPSMTTITPGGPGSQSVGPSRTSSRVTTPGEAGTGAVPLHLQPQLGITELATPDATTPSSGMTGLAPDGSTSLAQMGLVPQQSTSSSNVTSPNATTTAAAAPSASGTISPHTAASKGLPMSGAQSQSMAQLLGSMTPIVASRPKYEEGTGAAGMGAPLSTPSAAQGDGTDGGDRLTLGAADGQQTQSQFATSPSAMDDGDGLLTPEDVRARSAPTTPHFGAQTSMLRTLDESTKLLRQKSKSRMPTRAPSVSGIGNLVEKPDYSEAKIVVAMVGLPARGKSYLSNKLMRYLRWLEYKVDVFNVGQLRRARARDMAQAGGSKQDHSASYFSHSNKEASELREQLANDSLDMLITWLKAEGNVGIHDATNSTRDRRAKIQARLAKEPNLQLLFLESYCDDPAVIATNIALKVSSGDPDYAGMSKQDAERDFRKRIEQYESVYQTITEPGISFCRIMNVGRQVTINRIEGYLQSRIAFYLMNLHLKPRSIYLSRHGESMHNVGGMIGGDSPLSPRGEKYAAALPDLVRENIGDQPLQIWTSTLQRTVQTARFLPYPKKTWKSLDELDAGVCDGMTYEEIAEKYPEDYESRDDDKFNYRYRGGESYRDVVVRLEPVIMELERQENIVIICHQAIVRCLYGYFMGLNQEEIPYIKVPLHTLIKLTPRAYGCEEERFPLPIAAVDTHRAKPSKKSGAPPSNAISPPGQTAPGTGRDYFGTNTVAKNSPTLSASNPEKVVSPTKHEPSSLRNAQTADEIIRQDSGGSAPSHADIAKALQASSSSSRPRNDLQGYEDFEPSQVIRDLCTDPTGRKNARKMYCPREGCGSCILSEGISELVVGDGSLLPQDPAAPFQPDPVPTDSVGGKSIYYWHVAGSPFAFDNIGFTRNAVEAGAGKPKIKWLICAECDLGPLGYSYEGGKEAWVGVGRVKYASK